MLKRLILSIILLLLCFSVGIGSYVYVENSAQNLAEDFQEVYDLMQAQQYTQAIEKLSDTQEKWDNVEFWYNIFLDYSLFEQLEINIALLEDLIEIKSYEYANTKLLETIQTLKSIIHEQKISLGNVLVVY